MHDHDLDVEAAGPDAARRRDDDLGPATDAEIGRGVEAGRPDALGPGGLLHLQRLAGNSGVAGLVAQRRAAGDEEQAAEPASPVHDVVGSAGSPLEPGLRKEMESAVGADFGDVHVHTDGKAAASARPCRPTPTPSATTSCSARAPTGPRPPRAATPSPTS